MARKDITAGVKTGKILGARFIESKGGKPAIELAIDFKEQSTDTVERLFWQGWLTDAAVEHTMKTLVEVCDYNGSLEVDGEGKLTDPNAFTDKEISVTVDLETRKDENGMEKLDDNGNAITDPKIKWLNKAGGSAYVGITPDKIQSSLKAVGFKAAFQVAKKKAGSPVAAKSSNSAPPPEEQDENEKLPW